MNTITIPKKFSKKDDLIIIPRREYEALVALKHRKEFVPTKAQKNSLSRAEKNLLSGKTISYYEAIQKLGFTN